MNLVSVTNDTFGDHFIITDLKHIKPHAIYLGKQPSGYHEIEVNNYLFGFKIEDNTICIDCDVHQNLTSDHFTEDQTKETLAIIAFIKHISNFVSGSLER